MHHERFLLVFHTYAYAYACMHPHTCMDANTMACMHSTHSMHIAFIACIHHHTSSYIMKRKKKRSLEEQKQAEKIPSPVPLLQTSTKLLLLWFCLFLWLWSLPPPAEDYKSSTPTSSSLFPLLLLLLLLKVHSSNCSWNFIAGVLPCSIHMMDQSGVSSCVEYHFRVDSTLLSGYPCFGILFDHRDQLCHLVLGNGRDVEVGGAYDTQNVAF
jgi:hypothetical protein